VKADHPFWVLRGGSSSGPRWPPLLLALAPAFFLCRFHATRTLSALAITRERMVIDNIAWATMITVAKRANGMTSVGLNAGALVNAR
jgi:hypothetical protein